MMELLTNQSVSLFNGKVIAWDEFARWGAHRQMMNLTPTSEGITYGVGHCEKMREIVKKSYADGSRRVNWNYGGKNGNARAVITPAGQFPCIKAACAYYAIASSKLKRLMLEQPHEYYFAQPIDKNGEKVYRTQGRKVSAPDGIFPSIKAAARYYEVSERTIKTWIRGMRAEEFKYV